MVFVDVRFYESRKTVTAKSKTKVVAKESDLLRTVVRNAVVKLLKSEGKDAADSDVDAAIKRIQAITTNTTDPGASDLIEFLESPDATLEALNTKDTPILADGIDIHLPKEIINVDDDSDAPEPALKKQKVCAFAMLMGTTAEKGVEYLRSEKDIDKEENIDGQILHKLYEHLEEIGLGYRDINQRKRLEANMQIIKNTLCFVQKYWKVLLRAEFPDLPKGKDDNFTLSKFISALQETVRRSAK
jgi:hypothetical protein